MKLKVRAPLQEVRHHRFIKRPHSWSLTKTLPLQGLDQVKRLDTRFAQGLKRPKYISNDGNQSFNRQLALASLHYRLRHDLSD